MWPYYSGVYYYLYHHFQLSPELVRSAGLSMGVPSCLAVALSLPPIDKFQISLSWSSAIWARPLKCFLMTASTWIGPGREAAETLGVTDDKVLSFKGTGAVSAGVTDISVFPPQQVTLTEPVSVDETNYWTTLSMRIFPFFIFPGLHKGMVIVDGCFTTQFSIPPGADESKVIKISPFRSLRVLGADVVPPEGESFTIREVLYSRYRDDIFKGLKLGYEAARNARGVMIEKGLVEKVKGNIIAKSQQVESKVDNIQQKSDAELQEGSLQHMLTSFHHCLDEFQANDKRKVVF